MTGADEQAGPALVSVVIPCYNQAHFLGEAIESALAQTYPQLEIVVVDDGSTDNTREVAASYLGMRYVRQANQGLAAARNTGLRHSTGAYLVFLDSDDRLLPQAVEMGLHQLQTHPECAFAAGHVNLIARDGSPLPTPGPTPLGTDHYVDFLRNNRIWTLGVVIYRRSVLAAVGEFDPSENAAADYDLSLRIARRYPLCIHDEVVLEHRRHDANMSAQVALNAHSEITVLRRQRRYVQGDPERIAAYRAGLRFLHHCYGRPLIEEVLAQAAAGELRRALYGLSVLLRDPALLVRPALRLLWRQRRPATAQLRHYARRLAARARNLGGTPGV